MHGVSDIMFTHVCYVGGQQGGGDFPSTSHLKWRSAQSTGFPLTRNLFAGSALGALPVLPISHEIQVNVGRSHLACIKGCGCRICPPFLYLLCSWPAVVILGLKSE